MQMKRALAVVLAASMVFGAAGCGKIESGKSESGTSAAENKTAVEVPEDIWEPYAEEVTLSTVLSENAAIKWEEGDDYDDNPWYREYKERFNVQVKNDWVSNDYRTKLNLSIAEGNLPDVFTVNSQQLKELQAADLIWDISEIWEENASDLLKSYMEENAATFETAKIDGKLYAVPELSLGAVDQIPVLWVKKDWKAESGVEDIKTIADFEKMVNAIKEKHGDFAITEISDLSGMFAMAPGWGAYPNIWIEKEDGSIEYGSIQPEMKQVLETYARWYEEGLLDPEFTITDGDKMFQKVLNEEAGVSPFSTWFVWGVGPGSIEQFGVEGTFDAYPMPTVNGDDAKAVIQFSNYGYNVISKKCAHPEAAIRLMNYYVYMVNGEGDEDPELIKSLFNISTIPYSFRVFNTNTENTRYKRIQGGLPEGSKADTSTWGQDAEQFNKCMEVIENNNPDGGGEYLQYGKEKCSAEVAVNIIENGLLVEDKLWGPPTETLGKTGSTLNDILIEGFTKIIVGDQPVDYFDTLVQNWAQAGGEQATKEVNEVYGK